MELMNHRDSLGIYFSMKFLKLARGNFFDVNVFCLRFHHSRDALSCSWDQIKLIFVSPHRSLLLVFCLILYVRGADGKFTFVDTFLAICKHSTFASITNNHYRQVSSATILTMSNVLQKLQAPLSHKPPDIINTFYFRISYYSMSPFRFDKMHVTLSSSNKNSFSLLFTPSNLSPSLLKHICDVVEEQWTRLPTTKLRSCSHSHSLIGSLCARLVLEEEESTKREETSCEITANLNFLHE